MSTIRVDNFAPSGGGTAYSDRGIPKATYNYQHTAGTIRQSTNVASITDNSTGLHTVNFTNDFDGINMQIATQCRGTGVSNEVAVSGLPQGGTLTASSVQFVTRVMSGSFTAIDSAFVSAVISGELA